MNVSLEWNERHPRICQYFSLYGNCKYENHCAYIHELPCKSEIDTLRRELSLVKQEVDILVQKIKALDFENLDNHLVNTDPTMSTSVIGQLDGNNSLQDNSHTSVLSNGPECEICNLVFRDPRDFNEHFTYEYICSICDICFKAESDAYCHEKEFHPEYPGVQLRRLWRKPI